MQPNIDKYWISKISLISGVDYRNIRQMALHLNSQLGLNVVLSAPNVKQKKQKAFKYTKT